MKLRYIQRRTGAIILLIIVITAVHAQDDALAAIHKMYNSYNSNTAIHFTGSMKMYAKNDPSRILDRIQSSYIVKNKNFSCSIGPVSMLLNDDYYVSVDNSEKLIMIGHKRDLAAAASAPVLNLEQIKKWITGRKIQAVVASKGAASILQLTDADGSSGFNTYYIEYNATTGYMKKVVLETGYYNSEAGKIMMLEINYSVPEPETDGKASFSEKPFFSIVNNKMQVSVNYKNYQIINQL